MKRGLYVKQEKVITFLIMFLFLIATVFVGIVSGIVAPNLKLNEHVDANEELLPAPESEMLRNTVEPISEVVEPNTDDNFIYGNDWREVVNPDGSRTQTIGFPTYYRDGAYHPVDTTIKRMDVDDYTFGVGDGKYQAYFKDDASEPTPVRVNYNNYELSMGLNEMGYFDSDLNNYLTYPIEPSIGQSEQNKIMYSNVLPNADLEYVYGITELKENIILNDISEFNFPEKGSLNFRFDITFPNTLEIWSAGNKISGRSEIHSDIDLRTTNGENIFSIPRPVIYERNNRLEQVYGYFEIVQTRDGWSLILKAPIDWIMDPAREFPIIVDPGIAMDTTVYSVKLIGLYRDSSSNETLYMGWWGGEPMYGLLQLNLSSIPAYSTIVTGNVYVYHQGGASGGGNGMLPFRVIEHWDETLADSSEVPVLAENYTTGVDMPTSDLWYSWNITGLVQGWISRYYANYGMAFTTNQPWGVNDWANGDHDAGTNPPYLNITYINNSVQIDPPIPDVITPEDTPKDIILRGHEHRRFEKFNNPSPTSANAIPFWGLSFDSMRWQNLYHANDIGISGIIEKIYFNKTGTNIGYFENFSVRFGHTTNPELSTNFDSNYHGELVEVFNRSRFYINQTQSNILFPIDVENIFNYQAHYNLVVDIRWNGDSGSNIFTRTSSFTNHRALATNYYATTATSLDSSRNNLKFEVVSTDQTAIDKLQPSWWQFPLYSDSAPAVRFQLLYRQSLVGKQGVIDKVYLQKSDNANGDNYGSYENLSISFTNTNLTELDNTYNNNYGSGTPVKVLANHTRFLGGKRTDWIEFDVEDTFFYNNYDHLLIEFRWRFTNATTFPGFVVERTNDFFPSTYISALYNSLDDYATTGTQNTWLNLIRIKFKDTDLAWDITNVDPSLMTINPSDVTPGDDKFTVTPVPDAFGLDPVRVTLTDDLQGWTASQWIDIEILPVNDPPIIPINVTPGDKTPKRWFAGPIPMHWEHQDIDSPQQNVSIEYKLGTGGTWQKLFNSTDFPFPYPDSDFLWLNPVLHDNIYIRVSTWDGEYWSPWNETPYPLAFDNVTPIIESVEIIDLAKNNHEYVRNDHLVLVSAKLVTKYFADIVAPGPHIFADLSGFSLGADVPLTIEVNNEYANITTPTPIITIPENGIVPVPVFIPTLFGDPIIFEASTIADNLGVEFTEPSITPDMWLNYTNEIDFSVNISDNGSGVDLSTIQYQISTDGGQNWNAYKDWSSSGRSSRADNVITEILVNLTEGVKNRLRWRAKDNIDNNYVQSPPYVIRIDTRGATYSEIIPATQIWYNKSTIKCSINISDNTSGVNPASIKYKYSTTGLGGYGPWINVPNEGKFIFGKSVRCEIDLNFTEGPNNWLQWYAEDLAGNVIETDQLNYLVDLTPPIYRDPDPPQDGWANSYQYICEIIFEDGYSGIDNLSIQYRTSKNGLTNYSGWKDAQFNDLTANEIEGIATGDFADGDQNYIQWRINDRAGNSIETVDYRINIDLTELEFSNPTPIFDVDPQTWSQTQSVLCSVKLDDSATGSGVDATSISFRYSTTGTADTAFNNWTSLGLTASENADNIIVSKNITFDYGDQNYIQWRAKDVAGNGWTESPKYQIKVTPLDSDGDSMPDSWEELFDLDPNDASDANDDDDNDGLTNLQEYELIKTYSDYTRPDKADTDGDGALDGEEVEAGTNPLDENDVPEKRTDKPDDKGDNYLWLIILIVIIIIVVLLIVFFLMRKKREEEPKEAEEEERPEGEEYPEGETEEEDLDEWKFEDEVEAPVAESEEMAAEEEEDFIDIDLKESSKPMKGKMPAEKKGKKPGVVRHGKPKKGKLPEKGKMPKKGKAPKKEIEPEIEPEEKFADDEIAGELAAAEAEPSEPFLVKLDESATCNICLGAIKTGLPVVKCTCGKKYHDSCAARVGECPNCDTDISNPISKLDEEDDEITAEDLDAIDDEE